MGKPKWNGSQNQTSPKGGGKNNKGWHQGSKQDTWEQPSGKGSYGSWGPRQGRQDAWQQRAGPYQPWQGTASWGANGKGSGHSHWGGVPGSQALRSLRSAVTNASDVLCAMSDIRMAVTGMFQDTASGSDRASPTAPASAAGNQPAAAGLHGNQGDNASVRPRPGLGLQGLLSWIHPGRPCQAPAASSGKPYGEEADPGDARARPGTEDRPQAQGLSQVQELVSSLQRMLEAAQPIPRPSQPAPAAEAGPSTLAELQGKIEALTGQVSALLASRPAPGAPPPGGAEPAPQNTAAPGVAPPAGSFHSDADIRDAMQVLAILNGGGEPKPGRCGDAAGPKGGAPGTDLGRKVAEPPAGGGRHLGGILRALQQGAAVANGDDRRSEAFLKDAEALKAQGVMSHMLHAALWSWLDECEPAGWPAEGGMRDDWLNSMTGKMRKALLVELATKRKVAVDTLTRKQILTALLDKFVS